MANVYVGFHDHRNSSRVLKPPGGGTSDIFGTAYIPDFTPQLSPKKEYNRSSSIQDVIQTETINKEPEVVTEVTSQFEQITVEERSSKSEVTETDDAGNTRVVSSDSKTEGSVEHSSGCKKGSSIGDILNQEEIVEQKKVKGSPGPGQRVPPGGYSSGLW